jgi:hypothetical protein
MKSGLTADYVVVAGQERSVDVSWIKNYGRNQGEKGKEQPLSGHWIHDRQAVVASNLGLFTEKYRGVVS